MTEKISRSADTAVLLEQYRELLKTVDRLPLAVTGSSMTPFLVPGRDSVWLTRPDGALRRGDIVLYRRESGAYVMHRIYRCARDGSYAMLGDAQQAVEHGIRRGQVLARVCAAERKGKYQGPGRFWWEFFARVWICLVPLRPALVRLYESGRKKA